MTTDAYLADCRARLAFDLLSNTWNAVLIWVLRSGPQRPGELRERIGGISPKVLTETLRRLEFNGLVARNAYAEAPPRVEYELTALGRTLLGPIDAFGAWAFEYGDEVMAAQERNEHAAASHEPSRTSRSSHPPLSSSGAE
ncbi:MULTISPECIES: helix-turn-helix domain-containing protein [unclassified Streptomyces]|uniref:winged helix-turn-helix transcriptional regulator n=1 Tax=unclassified Streptomyces TaxID=2593676 RepID=UPI0021CCFBB1|nr:helix-turn-helix domain-containing protein [Streptomyces sp. sk2.1]